MPRVAAPPDVREAVLDAATRIMDGTGFKKMTMEAIAHEAGIGKATIYGYFDNKEAVALSVIRRYQESVLEQWMQLRVLDAPPEIRVRKMLVCLVLSGFDRARRCQKSMDETLAALRQMILQKRFQFNQELADLLVVVLNEGVEQGRFVCANPCQSAQALITSMSGLYPTNLSPEELGGRDEIEDRANQVVDLVLNGLLTRSDCCHE
jgi:AcrR family transcriptional regulator